MRAAQSLDVLFQCVIGNIIAGSAGRARDQHGALIMAGSVSWLQPFYAF
jgi:hypothetical protein